MAERKADALDNEGISKLMNSSFIDTDKDSECSNTADPEFLPENVLQQLSALSDTTPQEVSSEREEGGDNTVQNNENNSKSNGKIGASCISRNGTHWSADPPVQFRILSQCTLLLK